jgi:hypothetical protein
MALLLLALPSAASAQALRIGSLQIPQDARPGPWVTYHVTTQSTNLPPRQFSQRIAIVSEEGLGDDEGVWVELKTVDPQTGTRIERGFFVRAEPPSDAAAAGTSRARVLRRVQRLNPDGKLYEYPPASDVGVRSNADVARLDLFEIDPRRAPRVDTLGVDTLRIGKRALISLGVRQRWLGTDEWPDEQDSTRVWRATLSVIRHECPDVPAAGYTRSTFEVVSQAFAAADSTGSAPLPSDSLKARTLYRAEVELTDLGTGAVPEVTQEPEPAADAEEPESPGGSGR